MTPVTLSQFLVDNGVYMELGVGQKWCFKFQPKGKPIIMCSHLDKETAAEMMVKELKLAAIKINHKPQEGNEANG